MSRETDDLELSENPTIESLQLLIGADLLAQLSADLGGSQISIPYKSGANSPMAIAIGLAAAQKISDVWGGLKFDVPLLPGRDAEILRLWEAGTSKNMIARTLKVGRMTVYRVIDKAAQKGQPDLFQP